MINDFGLYPKQRKRFAPEELIALMMGNIDIVPINENPQQGNKDFDAFRISFKAENALLAQQVTSTLTSLFINEYLRTGAEQSTNTTNFLHRQVEELRTSSTSLAICSTTASGGIRISTRLLWAEGR